MGYQSKITSQGAIGRAAAEDDERIARERNDAREGAMKAVDTHIPLRHIVQDDPVQSARAHLIAISTTPAGCTSTVTFDRRAYLSVPAMELLP